VAAWHSAEGEWCIKECVGHLIETEARGFAGRIRRILADPGLAEPAWDQEQVQRDRNDDARDLGELLEAFYEMRSSSIELVHSLLNTDLDKSCFHSAAGVLRVEDLLSEWVHHDRNHHRQILANVQAFAWPSMGNSRSFAVLD